MHTRFIVRAARFRTEKLVDERIEALIRCFKNQAAIAFSDEKGAARPEPSAGKNYVRGLALGSSPRSMSSWTSSAPMPTSDTASI